MMPPELTQHISGRMSKLDALMRQDLANSIQSPVLAQVIEHILFSGGKRLRPLLTLALYALCGDQADSEPERVYTLALCFEYTHVASLLHDDVIDHATERHNRQSANTVWSNTSVVLAGDFLHARALFLAGKVGGMDCLEVICQAVHAMIEAEYLQLENLLEPELSATYCYRVLQGKTATLIRAACETGVILAIGSTAQRDAARTFGGHLGLAFQIIDDTLDYTGKLAKTGKRPGNDWREQRITLPLIYALQQLDAADRQWLLEQFAAPADRREQSFAKAVTLIDQSGGVAEALRQAQQLIDKSILALEVLPDGPDKQLLTRLAHYVLQRQH